MREEFGLDIEVKDKFVVVKSHGRLPESAGTIIEAAFAEKIGEGFTRFILDLGMVTTISSPVVASILDVAEKIVDGKAGRLVVTGLTDLNLKVFEMVGIFLYAEECPTLNEAEVQALM